MDFVLILSVVKELGKKISINQWGNIEIFK